MEIRVAVLLSVLWWTLAVAELKLFHHKHHLLLPPAPHHNNSLFGFSLAFQQLSNGYTRMLVGAPTADAGGAVYSCRLTADMLASPGNTTCAQVPVNIFDQRRKHTYYDADDEEKTYTLDYEHDMWLGATVTAMGDVFVTCAPRWSLTINNRNRDGYAVMGRCYKVDSSSASAVVFTPTTEINCIMCNEPVSLNGGSGWSVAGGGGGGDGALYVGSPAACSTGAYFATNIASSTEWNGNSIFGYNLYRPSCPPRQQYPPPVTLPTINFGYAMALGHFMTPEHGELLAVSSLYGQNGYGQVILMLRHAELARIRDERVGSMFGAALCSVRAHRRDGSAVPDAGQDHDDLLVGAPLHAGSDPHGLERGVVFLYWGGTDSISDQKPAATFYGEDGKMRSCFGNSIAKLGDVDGDGNDEFAVGAPYEDEKGAVYVFSVRVLDGGEVQHTRQRISPGLRGFGFSLATLRDLDVNGCNELAVGAFDDTVVSVIPCQPVVTVFAETNIVNLTLWELPVGARSFEFRSCLRFEYPQNASSVTGRLSVKTTLKEGGAHLRPEDQLYTVQLNKAASNPVCRTIVVTTVPEQVTNRMAFSMEVAAMDDCFKGPYNPTCAVLSQRSSLLVNEYVTTHRCPGGVCRPNLSLDLTPVDITDKEPLFELGTKDSVTVRLRVRNSNDGAYDWCMRVQVSGVSSRLAGCESTRHVHSCQVGRGLGPIFKGNTRDFDLILYTEQLTSADTSVEVSATVMNLCGQGNGITKNFTLKFFAKPDRVNIKGISAEPSQSIDRVLLSKNSEKNITINHVYKVENMGPTTWSDIALQVSTVHYPYLLLQTPQDKDFSCKAPILISERDLITCHIKKLSAKSSLQVTVPLTIVYSKVGGGLDKPVNITTSATITIPKSGEKLAQGTTLLESVDRSVLRWWHILLACLAALLLLALIVFALYKYGFFKRESKKNLQELKRRSTVMQSKRYSRIASSSPATTEGQK